MVRRGRARGFTMLELLMSMALASVGLLGLVALQVTAVRGNAASRSYIEAVGVAQQLLEPAQYTPYASLSTLATNSCTQPITVTNQPTPYTPPGSPTAYTYCLQATPNANGTTFVEVMVQWDEPLQTGSSRHYVTVETTRSP